MPPNSSVHVLSTTIPVFMFFKAAADDIVNYTKFPHPYAPGSFFHPVNVVNFENYMFGCG